MQVNIEISLVNNVWVTKDMGFSDGTVVKSSPANAGDMGSIPGSGRSPREGNGSPLQYSCLGNPTDRGAWRVTAHVVTKESDTTEQLNNNKRYINTFQVNNVLKIKMINCSELNLTQSLCNTVWNIFPFFLLIFLISCFVFTPPFFFLRE